MKIIRNVWRKWRNIWSSSLMWMRSARYRRKAFIDCGSNTCKALGGYISKYGLSKWEIYAFEPQKELEHDYKKVREDFPGIDIHFFPNAVWVDDTKLSLYPTEKWGNNYKGGSTILQGSISKNSVNYENPEEVEAIDFSNWLRKTCDQDTYVVVKMDIEGAEYDVLEKCLEENTLNLVKELFVEFHYEKNNTLTEQRHLDLLERLEKTTRVTILVN